MKLFPDFSTIKAAKRNNINNPITLAFKNFILGCNSTGIEITTSPSNADVVLVFGSITRRKSNTERAKSILAHRNNNKKIISLDSSFFSTQIRSSMNTSETFMFRVGFGDCVGSKPFENYSNNPNRFRWFTNSFDFYQKKPSLINNGPIMFILQTERGWQYDELIPYVDWAKKTLIDLRSITNRTIILRAHPNQAREPIDQITGGIQNVTIQQGERARMSIIKDFENISSVVTHSSSAAAEALVEGIPAISLNERCIAFNETANRLEAVNEISYFNWEKIEESFYRWANSSFHVNEFKEPEKIKFIMQTMEKHYD